MDSCDKVSIIIPVYNAEKYIDDCLDSCVNQSYKNIEVVCVNDGSSDDTLNHIEQFMDKYKNICLINQENSGVSVARNVGLKHSTGKYVMFVDSDDYLSKNMVEVMMNELVRTNADAVKCNVDTTLKFLHYSKIDENKSYFGDEYQRFIIKELFVDNNVFCTACNGIYKKDLCGEFPECFRLGEDVLFNAGYFLKAKSVALISDSLYHYRDNPVSVTHNPTIETIVNNLEHFNSYYYVENLVKDMEDFEIRNHILERVASRNFASYMRLMFQIFRVANFITSVNYAKKYYKIYEDVFDKVEYSSIKKIVTDSYHWTDLKVKTSVEPFFKRQFLKSYIGYKYIYKGKRRKNR